MARVNPTLQHGRPGAAVVARDASSVAAGKRSRKSGADDARPTKRARKATDTEDERRRSPASEPRRSARDRNSGDGNRLWQAAGSGNQPSQGSPSSANAAMKTAKTKKTTKKTRPARDSTADADLQKRKPGRSGVSAGATSTTNPPTGAKGSKQSKSRNETAAKGSKRPASPQESTSAAVQANEKRRRRSDRSEEGENQEGPESQVEEETEDGGREQRQTSGGRAVQPFRQLVPRTRLIPMATMTSKWAPLERDAIAAVQALLADCARPVLSRLRTNGAGGGGGAVNERRQEQARQAIAGVTRRLRSKLVKGIPFPPATVSTGSRGGGGKGHKGKNGGTAGGGSAEADFNFERAVEGTQALEQQLNPLQHAIALLDRERRREEEALEADYTALRQLETNAQAEMRTWRERTRRAHVLAPVDDGSKNDGHGGGAGYLSQVELVERPPPAKGEDDADEGVFENLDKDLSAVAAQLGNHMDSLKGNLQQIEGVVPAMARSRAALQHVLHQRLDPHQYERILLGQ